MSETFGLIVGSGYELLGLEVLSRSPTKTPYGAPSSAVLSVRCGERRIACIARHGENHAYAPHEINYRANIWALKARGVRSCVAVNTVGAIADGFAPGELAVPDQLIDYTSGRASSYGGGGEAVVHVEFTEPFSSTLRARLVAAAVERGWDVHGGTYGVTQGPRLETAAEIARLARDGCAMVGMTALPEAALAREAGIDYAICALAVNYGAGRAPDGAMIAEQVGRYLESGMRRVAGLLAVLCRELGHGTL